MFCGNPMLGAVAILLLGVADTMSADNCYQNVHLSCAMTASKFGKGLVELPACGSLYGAFRKRERYGLEADYSQDLIAELQAYANLHIDRSFDFLLSSAFFNNYETNRDGFTKLFRKMSDEAWGNAVGLIKHIAKRGQDMDFDRRLSRQTSTVNSGASVELHELGALAQALDVHKELAERAFHIHREATRNKDALHDAEIAQYLEEEFIEQQADTIRDLAGHTTDVKGFIGGTSGHDTSMALYLFDMYLAKIV